MRLFQTKLSNSGIGACDVHTFALTLRGFPLRCAGVCREDKGLRRRPEPVVPVRGLSALLGLGRRHLAQRYVPRHSLSFIVYGIICRLSFIVCHLSFIICYLSIYHLPGTWCFYWCLWCHFIWYHVIYQYHLPGTRTRRALYLLSSIFDAVISPNGNASLRRNLPFLSLMFVGVFSPCHNAPFCDMYFSGVPLS